MKSTLRKYATTSIGALITITLSLISDFILKLPPETTWITFFVGSIVTITATILEQNILESSSSEIDRKLEIYSLLEKIQDEELYNRGKAAIEICRVELENLSKGILGLETGQLFRYLVEITETAKHHIRVTHIGLHEKYVEMWQTGGEQQWYKQNVKLVKRGVLFERLFILNKALCMDKELNKLKAGIKEMLQKQIHDGVKVLVVWQDDLVDRRWIKDFAIVDSEVVLETKPDWIGGYSDVTVYRKKFDVEGFTKIFEDLRSRSRPIPELDEPSPKSS